MKKEVKFSLADFDQLTAQEESQLLGGGDGWKGSTTVDHQKVGAEATGSLSYQYDGVSVNGTVSSAGSWNTGIGYSNSGVNGGINYDGSSKWGGSVGYDAGGLKGSIGINGNGVSVNALYGIGNGWSIGGGGSGDNFIMQVTKTF